MIYEIEENIIKVYDKTQFNPKHILECGQVFRYGINDDGDYYVYSGKYKAVIREKETHYEIISNNTDYFINYFDLNTDYNIIKKELSKNSILSPMINYGYGIRILNADSEEMIYSFILSQNNNIKRIQKIINKLCEIGEKVDDYNAFPDSKLLSNQTNEFFSSLGAGYRDKFLKSAADFLATQNLDDVKKLSTDEILTYLLSINGIGLKVASCVLLFGFGRKEKFPVDTWLEQVYYNHFSQEKRSRTEIQNYFESEFGEYSGIAQQYLFYYERNYNSK